ncbi:MAG: TonB-dependent receptor [Burkholderiaceae bacterium]|jgi:hypothetical protein
MFSLTHVSRAAATLLLALACADAFACSACGCTLNADWATQGLTSRTGLTADLRDDFFNQDDLRSGTGRVDRASLALPNDAEIQQHTVNRIATLTLDYGITSDWGVTLTTPWISRSHTTIAEGDTGLSSSRSSSLGDVRVMARYTGFSDAQDWGLQLGLKLPTGDSHGVNFDAGPQQGAALDRGLQPGTGSTDLLVGAFKFGAISETTDWFGQALLQIPVIADRALRPGIGANLTAGVRYRGFESVVPQMQFNARVERREAGSDADTPNSGATLVYFSPGATFKTSERTSVYLFAQVPVYQRVTGLQLEPKWSVSAGVHAAF